MYVCMYVRMCVTLDHTVVEPLIALLSFLVRLKFQFLYSEDILKCYDGNVGWWGCRTGSAKVRWGAFGRCVGRGWRKHKPEWT